MSPYNEVELLKELAWFRWQQRTVVGPWCRWGPLPAKMKTIDCSCTIFDKDWLLCFSVGPTSPWCDWHNVLSRCLQYSIEWGLGSHHFLWTSSLALQQEIASWTKYRKEKNSCMAIFPKNNIVQGYPNLCQVCGIPAFSIQTSDGRIAQT
jgi:hypothetical protein